MSYLIIIAICYNIYTFSKNLIIIIIAATTSSSRSMAISSSNDQSRYFFFEIFKSRTKWKLQELNWSIMINSGNGILISKLRELKL